MSTISDHSSGNFLLHELTKTTPFLGLELYIVICVFLFIFVFLVLLIFLCIRRNQRSSTRPSTLASQSSGVIPLVYKEIVEVEALDLLDIEEKNLKVEGPADLRRKKQPEYDEEINVGFRRGKQRNDENDTVDGLKIGWGRWYSLEELKLATRGFADENVIGEGGYGIVYRGILQDGSVVAVKKLLNNKGQAEKEFKVEVEAIGKVKHKNLVGLIGYCAEGSQRILVYEFVENGNLEQWLHGEIGPARASPLTWDIRTRIAIGTAKGLAYLHEGLEPKVVHRDVKSSNILLDKRWNAKVSDFGLAKLLGPEKSYVSTRVMGTFGYVSPEYASTGMLNEGNDVYSFGVLLMEIITGRSPIDYSRSPAEMNLVDWFKGMVASRRGDELVDPSIEIKPSPRSLKRALLVCLRCIDMDVCKRPKMSQIVHMLEADDFPFRSELRAAREKDPVASHASVSSKISYLPKHVDSVERSRWR